MLFWILATAHAATYEVGPSDDLFAVLENLSAGDSVTIRGGTYTTQSGGGSWFRQLTLNGTESDPIVIEGAPGELVRIEGDPAASQNILNLEGTHFTIRNLEFVYGSRGLRLHSSAFGTLEELHIHDTGDAAVTCNDGGGTYEGMHFVGNHIHDTAGAGECFYLGCNDDACQMWDSTIENNWCHDTQRGYQGDGIEIKTGSYDNIVRNNLIHDVNYPGITTYGTRGRGINVIEGNVIYNTMNQGIQTVGEAIVQNNILWAIDSYALYSKNSQGQDPEQLVFANNTVYNPGGVCLRVNDWSGGSGLVAMNNALFCEGGSAIVVGGGAGSSSWSGNAVTGSSQAPGGTVAGGLADEAFADPANGDFYPLEDGLLVDAGSPDDAPAQDFTCTERDRLPDIGAFERTEGRGGWTPADGMDWCVEGDTDTDTGHDELDTGEEALGDRGACGCVGTVTPTGGLLILGVLATLRRRTRQSVVASPT